MRKIEFKNKIKETVGTIEIKNIIDSNTVEMNIYGDIVSDELDKYSDMDVCPQDVLEALSDIGTKDLEININSCGGSVFAGIGIYNAIKQKCKGNITVNITGIGASIASVIAMAGNIINMGLGSQLMIHKPLCMTYGNATDFQSMIGILNKVEESILDIYMENVNKGVTREQIQALMEAESYLTTEDCKKLFKNVVVTGSKNVISNSIKNEVSKEEKECNCEDEEEVKCENDLESEQEQEKPIETEENIEDECKHNCKHESEDECKEDKKEIENKFDLDSFVNELSIFLCEKLN